MFRPLSVFIGSRYVRARRRNQFISFISLTSMLGLSLGVLALIVVLSVMNGFREEMGTRILGLVPHAVVHGDAPMDDWQAVAHIAKQAPDVLAAAPITRVDGMLSYRGGMQPLQIHGVDPAMEGEVSSVTQHMYSGEVADLQPGEFGIILGNITARRFGLGVGDKVTLIIPEPSESVAGVTPRLQRMTVVGTFGVGAEIDGSMAMIHRSDAAALKRWPEGSVEGVRLRLGSVYQAESVTPQLQQLLGNEWQVENWTHTQGSLFSAMQMEKTMVGLLLMLIIAVAAFNIVATLIMVVTDKRTDIAILRTLGMTPKEIMAIFMVQGSLIGVVGTSIGVFFGVLLALNITDLMAWVERMGGSSLYFANGLPSKLEVSDVLMVAAVALVLSFLATLYPAWRAAQTEPAEALRYA